MYCIRVVVSTIFYLKLKHTYDKYNNVQMKSVQKGSRRKSFDLCEYVSYVAIDYIDIYTYSNLNFESFNRCIQNILGYKPMT